MTDLKHRSSSRLGLEQFLETHPISYSLPDIKKVVPRVNFKKIKLYKLQDFDLTIKEKHITKDDLDKNLIKLDLPIKRITLEQSHEATSVNPLRKKIEIEEEAYVQKEVVEKAESQHLEKQEEIDTKKEAKDITFNLEAEVLQEESIILSPAIVSIPPFKEDVLSTSGEQVIFVWPPPEQPHSLVKKKSPKSKKKPKHKTKPYFLVKQEVKDITKVVEREEKQELEKVEQQEELKGKRTEGGLDFPWLSAKQDYLTFEDAFKGGLESELLDIPTEDIVKQELQTEKQVEAIEKGVAEETLSEKDVQGFYEKPKQAGATLKPTPTQVSASYLTLKALAPEILPVLFKDVVGHVDFGKIRDSKTDFGIEFVGRATKMFEKFGMRLTPLRIIVLGGFVATLGYLLAGYFLPDFKILPFEIQQKKDKLVVRDLFKRAYVGAKESKLPLEIVKGKEVLMQDWKGFSPITEQERLALIQKARESLESRVDPFGQETVLPSSVIEQKMKEEEKQVEEIPMQRKQLELVGVISTYNKNLALVNVYTADYTVGEEDDSLAKETKLKTALSMAVPNRIEVSLLDPVENWYVKNITKSKARSEDPTIELVKGDKKFKLKVGQRVLLPEEKPVEEVKEEAEVEKTMQEEEAAKG